MKQGQITKIKGQKLQFLNISNETFLRHAKQYCESKHVS